MPRCRSRLEQILGADLLTGPIRDQPEMVKTELQTTSATPLRVRPPLGLAVVLPTTRGPREANGCSPSLGTCDRLGRNSTTLPSRGRIARATLPGSSDTARRSTGWSRNVSTSSPARPSQEEGPTSAAAPTGSARSARGPRLSTSRSTSHSTMPSHSITSRRTTAPLSEFSRSGRDVIRIDLLKSRRKALHCLYLYALRRPPHRPSRKPFSGTDERGG